MKFSLSVRFYSKVVSEERNDMLGLSQYHSNFIMKTGCKRLKAEEGRTSRRP
jgi:hypothetical protein